MKQPLAYIHPGAKIAASVVIDPFVTIENNVEIGEGTRICSNVTIMEGARIGKNCTIFPGAVISGIPQDLKFQGEETFAIIGDNTTIRESVTINRGTASKGKTIAENIMVVGLQVSEVGKQRKMMHQLRLMRYIQSIIPCQLLHQLLMKHQSRL